MGLSIRGGAKLQKIHPSRRRKCIKHVVKPEVTQGRSGTRAPPNLEHSITPHHANAPSWLLRSTTIHPALHGK